MPDSGPEVSASSTKHSFMDTQTDKTLSFEKASRQASIDSATYHEHALPRVWRVETSKEQMHRTIRQCLQAASKSPIMLQRWQNERGRDQPYDNVGWVYSVGTPGQKQENGKGFRKLEEAKRRVPTQAPSKKPIE
ncbi:hypothetical protein N7G274_007772 [Stereocaulon virgatum]|uniref:Uncharacterized protein n=1 Tax=Stereocaulon virgatum TaxID=373712 RepID=A0ABR4A0V6_9LECA